VRRAWGSSAENGSTGLSPRSMKVQMTVRELALRVGITERSVQRVLADLVESGVVVRSKEGRGNRYEVEGSFQLRHPLESERSVGELLELLA